MEALTVAARWAQYAGAIALFGELAFLVLVSRTQDRRTGEVLLGAAALVLISGFVWLGMEAATMSGRTVTLPIVETVLADTQFGRLWSARLALAAALLVFSRRVVRNRAGAICACVAAGALLGTLAWAGHGADDGEIHLAADALHLVAAGLWLGMLRPLAALLARKGMETIEVARRATARFSILGIAAVATILATGIANTWFTVGSIPALIGTQYGALLLLKIALFFVMVSFATINRFRLAPRLDISGALRALKRNARAELALGLGVLAIVGVLGIIVPGAHMEPRWPLPFTIDWTALTIERAYPTTYTHSPAAYDASSAQAGARLYAQNCAVCHGPHGKGDGPAAGSLAQRPADLTEHFAHHPEGDLFWWIQNGIPGTAMPGFRDRIRNRETWDVINYLHALADARTAKALTASVEPWRPIEAPGFVFQVGPGRQRTLAELRGHVVLLVLYTLPASRDRLQQLTDAKAGLAALGARIVALPEDDNLYELFAPRNAQGDAPSHVEFLIDREGYLRARWTPGSASRGWDTMAELHRQIERLEHEAPHPHPETAHAHHH